MKRVYRPYPKPLNTAVIDFWVVFLGVLVFLIYLALRYT